MKSEGWLMLNFTLPKEPSRVRVSVWRKLKKSGAVNIGQSLWLLPVSDEYMTALTEIYDEILRNNGEAYIMKSDFLSTGRTEDIKGLFNRARDEEYREFLDKCEDYVHEIEKENQKENYVFAEIEENEDEYEKLAHWLQKILCRDFFNAPLQKPSRDALGNCRRLWENFSSEVYARQGILPGTPEDQG